MSNKSLTILAIAAAAFAAAAFWQNREADKPASVSAESFLVQGLDAEAIGAIMIKSGNTSVKLVKQGSKFVVEQKGNYPAQNKQVNQLITNCLDIKTNQLITEDTKNYADLGVTDANGETLITFYKPDNTVLTGVVVGKHTQQGQGRYVRLLNHPQAFLSANVPWFQTGAVDFIDKNLVQINKQDVKTVTVSSGSEKYTIFGDPNSKTKYEGIVAPKGKRIKADAIESPLGEFSYVSFDDVKQAGEMNLNFNKKVVVELKDTTVYTFEMADANGKTFVKCTAEYMDKTPIMKEQGVESQEALKAKEAKLLAKDKATEFAKAHQNWIYEVAEYKAKNLAKPVADFLEDEPNTPAVAATADANAVPAAVQAGADASEAAAAKPADLSSAGEAKPAAEANEPKK